MGPEVLEAFAPAAGIFAVVGVIGWVVTTWLRVKHGYPLENSWGKAVYPKTSSEELERIKLLSQENAQLRAEMGSMKDRMAVLERIATDKPSMLAAEIEQLRTKQLN